MTGGRRPKTRNGVFRRFVGFDDAFAKIKRETKSLGYRASKVSYRLGGGRSTSSRDFLT